MSLDLEKHLVFVSGAEISSISQLTATLQYGSYHHNPVNVAIHICCVPLILFTGFCMVGKSFHRG